MNFIKKRIFIFLCLIFTASFGFGESQFSADEKAEEQKANFSESKTSSIGEGIFSLGWSFMMNALLSYYENDFKGPAEHSAFVLIPGIGLSYEKQFFTKFSLKGSFDFARYIEKDGNNEKLWLDAIGLSLSACCYPFAKQRLEKLYFGGGIATNFLMFTGNSIAEEDEKRTAISIFPALGWKQHFGDWAFCKFILCLAFYNNQ